MARTFPRTAANNVTLGTGGVGSLLSGASQISVHAWYKGTAVSTLNGANDDRLIQIYVNAGNTGVMLGVDSSTGSSTAKLRVAARSVTSDSLVGKSGTTSIVMGTTYSMGGLIDIAGDQCTPYLDGVSEGAGATAFANTTWTYGTPTSQDELSSNIGTNTLINGVMSEVAIWKVGLTAGEFLALSKGFSARFIRPQSLVFYLPLFGNNSPERDLMRGVTGTINGTLTKADHPRVIYALSSFNSPRSAAAAGVSGTLGSTLSAATSSILALETFTGTTAPSLAAATSSVAALETFSGTLAPSLAAATSAVSALETFSGTLASTLSAASAAITAAETFAATSAATLAAATAAVSALETFTGTMTPSLAAATFSGADSQNATGTLAATLVQALAAMSGTQTYSGLMAASLSASTFYGYDIAPVGADSSAPVGIERFARMGVR